MANKLIDLSGKRFGRLTVIERDTERKGNVYWKCICDCGNKKSIQGRNLRDGSTKSCGCLSREILEKNHQPTHGETKTRLYQIWRGMKKRCYQTTSAGYKNYGGRGITVCDEWIAEYESFRDWALSNGYNDGLTLDRIDSDGNYNPLNCRFVDYRTQENNRRNNHYIAINGVRLTLTQWANIANIPESTLRKRILKYGEEKAVKDALSKCDYEIVGGVK